MTIIKVFPPAKRIIYFYFKNGDPIALKLFQNNNDTGVLYVLKEGERFWRKFVNGIITTETFGLLPSSERCKMSLNHFEGGLTIYLWDIDADKPEFAEGVEFLPTSECDSIDAFLKILNVCIVSENVLLMHE